MTRKASFSAKYLTNSKSIYKQVTFCKSTVIRPNSLKLQMMLPGISNLAIATLTLKVTLGWSSIFGPGVHAFQIRTDTEGSKIAFTDRLQSDTVLQPTPRRLCNAGVYLNQTGKCYAPNSEGPCGALMKVTLSSGNKLIGTCTCKTYSPRWLTNCETRPTLVWRTDNKCYFMFDQGPCNQGEWLIMSEENGPICQRIPCPEKYNRDAPLFDGFNDPYLNFTFEYRGNCYTTQTQGFCPSDTQVAYFPKKKSTS
ncbi:unnamed protein product [Allacma fusca]|uniref:DUF4789 domain-containing protein n=1 Tax=Allacma fusca TaxID=39272 RepID=A0A8J2KT08_9HEXA|nr:unnamed protein product [Allacma fusca]